MNKRLKVLFIAGWGRSGSTMLDILLGQVDGFCSAGELRYVWDRGILENRVCGCSVAFRDCPVWSRVAAPWLKAGSADVERIVGLRDRFRTRDCWRQATRRGRRRLEERLATYVGHMGSIYRRLRDVTGCRVIVDSSKFPSHGYVAGMVSDVDLYVVHLTRDPRAVAFSWRRKKVYDVIDGVPSYITPHSIFRSSQYWLTWNMTAEYCWARDRERAKSLRLRYEDFVQQPKGTLQSIANMIGETASLDFISSSNTAFVKECHAISGNPARFRTGEVKIEADDQWRRDMRRWDRLLVTAITFPLLHRYGYLQPA